MIEWYYKIMIKNILNLKKHISQASLAAEDANRKYGFCKGFVFVDYLFSGLVFGSNYEDYVIMEFYRKSLREKNTFTTARRNWFTLFPRTADKSAIEVFDNKINFNKKFSNYVKRNWISSESPIAEVKSFVSRFNKVIFKPVDGCEGVGISILTPENMDRLDGLKSPYIVEELITQHPDMARLYPNSVNTIRIETLLDKNGDVHILNSIVIMGRGGSVVSNTHFGGIMCHIDPQTGIIDSKGRNPKNEVFTIHPDTNVVLPGYKIPNWEGVIPFAKQLAKVCPNGRHIGWDIVITSDGYDVIEGNLKPGHCTQVCDGVGRWRIIKNLI
jgi:hypothetical protein